MEEKKEEPKEEKKIEAPTEQPAQQPPQPKRKYKVAVIHVFSSKNDTIIFRACLEKFIIFRQANMFYYALKFNQSLNQWNISNTTNISNMFHDLSMFNKNINQWNINYDTTKLSYKQILNKNNV